MQTVRYFWVSLWKDGGTLLFQEDDRLKESGIFIRKYTQVTGLYFFVKYIQVIGYMY
jgi:hypothetical protein